MVFNAFEMNKVREYPDPNGGTFCEPDLGELIEHDEECIREFWTVYGRKPDGCVEALVDRDTKEDATAIYEFFTLLLESYIDEGYN